jgi:chitinase
MRGLSVVLSLLSAIPAAFAFDNSRYDNTVVYWGQNSYGAVHGDDPNNWQKTLSYYCQDDSIDVIPISFITKFFSTGGLPEVNLASTCNNADNPTFPGSALANCQSLAADIKTCQSKGKMLTISLGGATGSNSFSSDDQARSFADQVWNLFLGGSSSTRPFGDAVLDGVDLDIESGTGGGYTAFVNQLRSHFNGASKKYYVTAAPQCVYPDAALGTVLNNAFLDAIYVQFYNNPCGVIHYPTASAWNFGIWDYWARSVSKNPNVKVFVGAPAADKAGGGYVDINTLGNIAVTMRKSFPSFGGVMLWDASQAYVNGRYEKAIKSKLSAAGGTGFTFPACSAPAYASGSGYSGGSKVSYQGYIWEAKWFASSTPKSDPNGEWSAISACSGGGTGGGTTTTTTTSGNGGGCAGVAAWNSATAYTGGQKVSYNGHVWTAKWWTQNETPGSSSGVWTDGGACFARTAAPAPAAHATSASRVSSVSAKATTASHSVSIASSKPISHSASASVKETASASASVKETAITIASVSAEASKPSEVKRSRAFRPDYYL